MKTLSDIVTESDMLIRPTKNGINMVDALSQQNPKKYFAVLDEQGKPADKKHQAYFAFFIALVMIGFIACYLAGSWQTRQKYDSIIKKHQTEKTKNA